MESVNAFCVDFRMERSSEWVTATVRGLRERAGFSMDSLAQAMGYRRASSIQRYEDPGNYKKPYLDRDFVSKLGRALIGKGDPEITSSEVWQLAGPEFADSDVSDHETSVPLMGYVGAGAEVEPEFDQVPPEGLDQISVPFPLPGDMIAFKVRGASMLPVFRDGTVIIVYREQRRALESFYGEEAAVRTSDGRRFIKQIMRGPGGGVSLFSWNAQPIEDVQLDWIGEIFAVLPNSALRRVERQGGVQGQLRLRVG